jgi:hypothetical protein
MEQSRYGDSDVMSYNQNLLLVMKQHGLLHDEEEEEVADYLFH